MQAAYPNLTFLEHLNELRSRLFFSLFFFTIFSVIGYILSPHLIKLLTFSQYKTLYYTTPTGGFSFVLEVSLLFGFILAMPIFIYQILSFVKPALSKEYANTFYEMFFGAIVFAISGVCFAYFFSLPAALNFLSHFGSGYLESLLTAQDYLKFVTTYLLGFGLAFELPVLILIINNFVTLSAKTMLRYLKHVIVASFIVGGIITPTPDVINQIMLSVPIIIIYLISIVIIWQTNKTQ